MILALLGLALASPDASPAAFSVSSDELRRLNVSSDGGLVAAVSNGRVYVLSVDAWSTASSSICDANDVAIQESEDLDQPRIWVACADGTVRALDWDGASLAAAVDDDERGSVRLAGPPPAPRTSLCAGPLRRQRRHRRRCAASADSQRHFHWHRRCLCAGQRVGGRRRWPP